MASKTTIEIDFGWNGERHKVRLKLEPTPSNLVRAANIGENPVLDRSRTFDPKITLPNSSLASRMGDAGTNLSVGELLDRWLAYEEKYLKHSTLSGYIKIVNGHLRPRFGRLWIGDLTTKLVRDFLEELHCSDKTKRNILSPLRTAFDFALEREYLDANR